MCTPPRVIISILTPLYIDYIPHPPTQRLEHGLAQIECNGSGGDGLGVAVGSRAHLLEDAIAERSALRNFAMWGLHMLVWLLCVRGVQDTQCGFKLFTRVTARQLFPALHIERWAFDLELLYLCRKLRIPIAEEAVNWTEIDGSKLDVASASLQIFRDLCMIQLCYTLGVWKVNEDVLLDGGGEPNAGYDPRQTVGRRVKLH